MSSATALLPKNIHSDLHNYVATFKNNAPVMITPDVIRAAKSIAFNPFFWNSVGRLEHKTHVFTKLTGGNKYIACYLFAATVFSLGIMRDFLYYKALQTQPVSPFLSNDMSKLAGILSAGFGHILVLSSMWTLGVTGTYLGDYFGILMDHKVECFPFNLVENPMYVGSTLSFLGVALYEGKAVGIGLSALVWVIYRLGLLLEEPFTEKIYSEKKNKLD